MCIGIIARDPVPQYSADMAKLTLTPDGKKKTKTTEIIRGHRISFGEISVVRQWYFQLNSAEEREGSLLLHLKLELSGSLHNTTQNSHTIHITQYWDMFHIVNKDSETNNTMTLHDVYTSTVTLLEYIIALHHFHLFTHYLMMCCITRVASTLILSLCPLIICILSIFIEKIWIIAVMKKEKSRKKYHFFIWSVSSL